MKQEVFDFISKQLSDEAQAVAAIKDIVGVIEVWEKLQKGQTVSGDMVNRAFQTAFYGASTNGFAAAFGGMFKPMVLDVMARSAKSSGFNAAHEFLVLAVPAAAINLKGIPVTDYPNIVQRVKDFLRTTDG